MTSPAIRILLADDHALIREALRQILNSCSSFEVVGEAASAAGTIELVRSTQAQILILDLSMPDRNAIEVIRVVKDIEPAIRILVLTMHGERQYAVCAFRASATRYAAASVFERPRTRCIPAHHGGRNDRRDCSPAMREHEDRQHLQGAYPGEDAHGARRGAGALCDAPQTFRRQRRAVSARRGPRTCRSRRHAATGLRAPPGSARLTAPTPAS